LSLHESPAILLDVVDLHDRDRIVTFLTPIHGKRRGVAQGARRRYSRYAGRLQPLTLVELVWFEKENRDLVRLRDVQVVRSVRRLDRELELILLTSYLAEQVVCFAQENEPSVRLFRLLDATVQALEAGCDWRVVARYFEVWMLRLNGLFPSADSCVQCECSFAEQGAVLSSDGMLLCATCGTGARVGPAVLSFLKATARLPPAAVQLQSPPADVLARVEALCAQLRRSFLGNDLRSYQVMQRTLAETAEHG
jgi:DNA repair protein RecO (recombination protein O)